MANHSTRYTIKRFTAHVNPSTSFMGGLIGIRSKRIAASRASAAGVLGIALRGDQGHTQIHG